MSGFLGFSNSFIDNEKIMDTMLDTIKHRGPDGQGIFSDGDMTLGFRRLAVIDIEGGGQPMENEDGSLVLCHDGTIYNYKHMHEELAGCGHVFKTQSDSEVLLHAYEEYGTGMFDRLRGSFSFVIWNKKEKTLFGARDCWGSKPFYYALMPDTFMVGSEIKGFLPHPGFKKEFDESKLPEYLLFNVVPGYDSFFKNVHKLAPGHYFEYRDGTMEITRYFTAKFEPETDKDLDYWVDEISKTVSSVVADYAIGDVPFGSLLSSGVDSSYIVCELADTPGLKTYTAGYDNKGYSEVDNAKAFANEIGLGNESKIITPEEFFKAVGTIQYHMDEPLANSAANPLFFVSRLAAKDVKVVFSGEGADEMFGGYIVYRGPLEGKSYKKLPAGLRRCIAKFAMKLPRMKGRSFLIRAGIRAKDRYLAHFNLGDSNIFSKKLVDKVCLRHYDTVPPQSYTKPFFDAVEGFNEIDQLQYVDMHVWMIQEIALKADKMTMANSLDMRAPLLDMEIFNIAKRLPTEYKVNDKDTKYAFRRAANRKMSDRSANRRKIPFITPLNEWMREDKYYGIIREALTGDVAKKFFDTGELVRILEQHRTNKRNHFRKLWAVYTFIIWYNEFFIKR